MQGAALVVNPPAAASTCTFALPSSSSQNVRTSLPLLSFRLKRRPLGICYAQQEQDYVVYDAKKSVFPAEACEELGGDSCELDGVGPEVKSSKAAAAAAAAPPNPVASGPDREYVEYKENKTVFPGEACDDLGGEFCEPEYQSGVYPEKVASK